MNLQRMKDWPCAEVIGVADGRRLDAKRANATREKDRDAAWAKLDAQWQEEGDLADLPRCVFGKAVGSLRPEATERVMCIAKRIGMDMFVAPFEAEHQLVHLQRTGRIDVIACNDSDYIALGGTNLLICSKLWTGSCRFFSRQYLTERPVSVGKRDLATNTDDHSPFNAFQEAVVGAATLRDGESADDGKAIERAQQRAVGLILRYCLLVSTDYSHIPNVGPARAATIVAAAWRSDKIKLTELADAVAGMKGVTTTASAALQQMYQALVCLRYTLVFDPETTNLVPLHGEPRATLFSKDVTRESMGYGALDGIDPSRWYHGGYDVEKAEPSISSPRVYATPREPEGKADAAGAAGSAKVWLRSEPHERPTKEWGDAMVTAFLKSKWVTMPKHAHERLEMAQWAYDNPRFLVTKEDRVMLEAEQAQLEKEAWRIINSDGPWIDVHSSESLATATLPSFPANVVRSYLADVGADTLRCTDISQRRNAWGGKIMRTKSEPGKDGRMFSTLHFTCNVARSVGREVRVAFASCLVDDASNTVFAVTRARCVYPDGCFDERGHFRGVLSARTGAPKAEQPTPCRQQSCGCVHGAVALSFLRSKLSSSAERRRPRRKRDTDVDTHQSAANAVFVGADGGWNLGRAPITSGSPFSTVHHARITNGLGDKDYKGSFAATVATRKHEYDKHYRETKQFGMIGRALAVESIMSSPSVPKKSKSSQ
jgi:hypothetical protein